MWRNSNKISSVAKKINPFGRSRFRSACSLRIASRGFVWKTVKQLRQAQTLETWRTTLHIFVWNVSSHVFEVMFWKFFKKFRVLTRLKLPIYSRYKLQREEHRRGTSVASLLDELKRIAKDSRSQSCLPRPSRTLPNPEPPSRCDWPIFSLVHWTKSCLPVPSLSYRNSKVTSTSDL